MNNYVIVKNPTGEDIKIEIVFSFSVEEYKKNYIAYTINDDNISETEPVFISEYDEIENRLISIPFEQKDFVLQVYNDLKKQIMEN